MPKVEVDVAIGAPPTPEQLEQLTTLMGTIMALPEIREAPVVVALNALLSAFWTMAISTGRQDGAAQLMVQTGGQYLARKAMAEMVARPPSSGAVH
jgi:hypothetical protein